MISIRTTRQILLIICFFMASAPVLPQAKKAMNFNDIMKFKTIQDLVIADDGSWIAYVKALERGDPEGILQNTADSTIYNFERGTKPVISQNSSWAAFTVKAKALEIANSTDSKDKPKSSLALFNIPSAKRFDIENVSAYSFSNDSKWLAYRTGEEPEKITGDKYKNKIVGTHLFLRHLESATEIDIKYVTEYLFDSTSNYIFYTISDPSGKRDGVYYRDLQALFCPESPVYTEKNFGFYELSYSVASATLAFLSSGLNSDGDAYKCSLWNWDAIKKKLNSVLTSDNTEKNWFIPYKNSLKWSQDGKRLFFGLKPEWERYKDKKDEQKFNDSNYYNIDTILKRTQLKVWHWNDPKIIPNQEKYWDQEKDKTYMAVFHLDSGNVIRLADTSLPQVLFADNPSYSIGYNDNPYMKEITWSGFYRDLYLIDLKSGQRKLIAAKLREQAYISPDGKFVTFYKDRNWFLYDIANGTSRNLTGKVDVVFYDEENDLPAEPEPYGFAAWFNYSKGLYLYDRYDIWFFNTENEGYINTTTGLGRDLNISYRFINMDSEKKFIAKKDTIYLSGFNEKTKAKGYYLLETMIIGALKLYQEDNKFQFQVKARNAPKMIYTIEKYDLFPDLYVSDLRLTSSRKLTDLNTQLNQYRWGKAELIDWQNSKGDTLQGYIIKPDDFNPKKKYPVLIYFYDRFSDRFNDFSTPRINHRPCYQLYSGEGYVVFLPDIKYRPGNPGMDATDCLVSGARKLISLGIADSNAIGIQGHSWGGYQSAFVITQTNLFKAASAGAPVGNMTSAYSGIRLESGMARQFQYEKEQSRIGGMLWDSLSNYINNSPVFQAKKITTPLLIMFGDQDEAVPWQQGIELYLAMRRLNKECYFLQYGGEPHHPRKIQNQLDYAIKMKQFFDHYLRNQPAPEWMSKGVPFKGK